MSSVKLVKDRIDNTCNRIIVQLRIHFLLQSPVFYVLTPFCFPVGDPASLSLPLVGTNASFDSSNLNNESVASTLESPLGNSSMFRPLLRLRVTICCIPSSPPNPFLNARRNRESC